MSKILHAAPLLPLVLTAGATADPKLPFQPDKLYKPVRCDLEIDYGSQKVIVPPSAPDGHATTSITKPLKPDKTDVVFTCHSDLKLDDPKGGPLSDVVTIEVYGHDGLGHFTKTPITSYKAKIDFTASAPETVHGFEHDGRG